MSGLKEMFFSTEFGKMKSFLFLGWRKTRAIYFRDASYTIYYIVIPYFKKFRMVYIMAGNIEGGAC